MLSLRERSVSVRVGSCSGHLDLGTERIGLGVLEVGGGLGSFLCAFSGVFVRGGGLASGDARAAAVAAATEDGFVGVFGGRGRVIPSPGSRRWTICCD